MEPFDLSLWPPFLSSVKKSKGTIVDQIVIDSRRIHSPSALFVALKGTRTDGHQHLADAAQAGAKYALVEDGVPLPSIKTLSYIRVKNTLAALQEIVSLYRKERTATVIAITGSFGKTMLKDLLQKILTPHYSVAASPESFNSQIGVPLSLLTIKESDEIALIEAAISEPGEMRALETLIAPDATIVTQVGKKHLHSLGSLATTAQEMAQLFNTPKAQQWLLIPKDPYLEPHTSSLLTPLFYWNLPSPTLPHTTREGASQGSHMPYSIRFPEGEKHSGTLHLGFSYVLDLINIATKAAYLLKVPTHAIIQALQDYNPEPTRTEIWKSSKGATFINDSYCSDPQSIESALRYFQFAPKGAHKRFLFGGMRTARAVPNKDYQCIGTAIAQAQINELLLIGAHSFSPLVQEVEKRAPATTFAHYPSHAEALEAIKEKLQPSDFVLLKGNKKEPLENLHEAIEEAPCYNQCLINLASISENLEALRKKVGKTTQIMVMVKALAYGTDHIWMGKFLETCGITHLGVSHVEEAVALKRAGITQTLFVFNAAPFEVKRIAKWELEVGASDLSFIEALGQEATKQRRKLNVHLHIDTGMGRFGCRPENALSLARAITAHPHLHLEGILTHFSRAELPEEDDFTLMQSRRFDKTIKTLQEEGIDPLWKHAANSSATARFSFPQYNMIRIGLALYGLHLSPATKKALELKPALSLLSQVVGVNHLNKGETVGYGTSYTVTKEAQTIATLPIGYFDGLHRKFSGKANVVIRGKKVPLIGNICMDFLMVDVSEIPEISLGDPALIFGEDAFGNVLSPELLASQGNSNVHELACCLGPRIPRIFIHEEAPYKETWETTNNLMDKKQES